MNLFVVNILAQGWMSTYLAAGEIQKVMQYEKEKYYLIGRTD